MGIADEETGWDEDTTPEPGMTYDELMAELDDSDQVGDPQDDGGRDPNGYCKHGNYVGGIGIDFMCGPCECGD